MRKKLVVFPKGTRVFTTRSHGGKKRYVAWLGATVFMYVHKRHLAKKGKLRLAVDVYKRLPMQAEVK